MNQQQILKRRTTLLIRTASEPINEAINSLSKELNCSEDTLYGDWATRETWINEAFDLNDPVLFAQCILSLRKVATDNAFRSLASNNESVKVGAEKLIILANEKIADLLIKAGFVRATNREETLKQLTLLVHPDMMSVDDNSNKSSVAATEAETVNEQSGTSDS